MDCKFHKIYTIGVMVIVLSNKLYRHGLMYTPGDCQVFDFTSFFYRYPELQTQDNI